MALALAKRRSSSRLFLHNPRCRPDPEPPTPLPPTPQNPQGVPPAIDDPRPEEAEPVREPRAPAPPAVAA
jgi:hypothetical protein